MAPPSFTTAWAASQRIYSATDQAEKVAKMIGGAVAANIHDKKAPWENTCAVRISYILNQSGLIIPAIPGKTVKGADHKNYFYRVVEVIKFLKVKWGAPQIVEYPASGGGPLAGKKGLILFEIVGFSNASGHATLFDGTSCYDHCYFNEPDAKYRTTKANFWALQ